MKRKEEWKSGRVEEWKSGRRGEEEENEDNCEKQLKKEDDLPLGGTYECVLSRVATNLLASPTQARPKTHIG